MPTLTIDGREITVEEGTNLIEAAAQAGIEIPHYCYHPGLSIAGNCRMCLVEIEKMPKLQIACNTRATDGMVVATQSERTKHTQAAVLEFLLINHPIDCPICDQAGECKLQDYYMDYDRNPSRVPQQSKVRKEKARDIGPLVMLDQERCILCTRCTRFLDEVTHTGELGIFDRGDHCRIDLFPGKALDNPYSGNVVDICPVGALTNKDFRFRARVWYLETTPSICTTCATGCNIDVHHRSGEVFRFRPRRNDDVNRFWMCDEGRLSYRRLQGEGRLLQPVAREPEGWQVRTWDDALGEVSATLRRLIEAHGAGAVAGLVSSHATSEEIYATRRWLGDTLGAEVAGFAWSPPDAYRDDFLIDADRTPNQAGLRALGLDPAAADALLDRAGRGELKGLVVVRADLAAARGEDYLRGLATHLEYLVVLDTHFHATAEQAHVLLPVATAVEADGTMVNRAGRVQRLREAVPAPAEVRPGWAVLCDLAARADGPAVPPDAAALFAELAAAAPPFAGLSYASVGAAGVPLASR